MEKEFTPSRASLQSLPNPPKPSSLTTVRELTISAILTRWHTAAATHHPSKRIITE
jgi:hypothetical protein